MRTHDEWERIFAEHPELREDFCVRLTRYCPHEPTPQQRAFLLLRSLESFYGGAAGGGKSDCLLMGALQYVDVPGYAALIIRRTMRDARRAGAILQRMQQWLANTPAAWDSAAGAYLFPTDGAPARVEFGYLDKVFDAYRYDSSEYQYIAFDELTQFHREDYEYLLTRLRRPRCPDHSRPDLEQWNPDPECPTCREFGPLSKVPLRMRSASNPGGIGHLWVKRRFDIGPIEGERGPTGQQLYAGRSRIRPHVAAFLQDNPFIDQQSYVRALELVDDPVTREQKLSGNWAITEDARFKSTWVRYWSNEGPWFSLGKKTWHEKQLYNVTFCDPAATTHAAPGTTELTKRQGSWTVVATFSVTPERDLMLRDVVRVQEELPGILASIKAADLKWRPEFVGVELSPVSSHLFHALDDLGISLRALRHQSKDKVARSVDACNRMERGKIWFPAGNPRWLQDWEEELFTWIGDPKQTDDQVDTLCYAAMYVSQEARDFGSVDDVPEAVF